MNRTTGLQCVFASPRQWCRRRQSRMSSVLLTKGLVFFSLFWALAVPLTAQQARWNELIQQAKALRSQGKYAEGIPVAQDGVQVAERMFGADHPNVAVSLNLLAVMYTDQGKYAEAEPLYRRSLAIWEKVLGPDHPDLAVSLNNLAWVSSKQGKYAEAETLYQRVLAIEEKALGPDHPKVAISLSNLAGVYSKQGKYGEAELLYQRCLVIAEKNLGTGDPHLATYLNNLAVSYENQGKYAEAEPLYQRGLAIREKALRPDDPEVADSLNNLAGLYKQRGRYAEAEPLYKRALAIDEQALGPDHPDLAIDLNNLAGLYASQGKYTEAEPLYQRSLAIREKTLGPDHPDVASSLNNLAWLYKEQGNYAKAEPLYQRSLAIREKALGPDHPDVAQSLNNLAALYKKQGRYAEAEPLLKRSLAIEEKTLRPDHPIVAQTLNNLAGVYKEEGKYAEAEPLFKRSLATEEKTLGPNHPNVAVSLNNLAELYANQGEYAEAEPLYQRSLAIREKALGPDHPGVADSLNNLAELYKEQGKYAEAKPLLERSLAIEEKALGTDHPSVATTLNNLAGLYKEQGQYAQAEPLLERSLAIRQKTLGPDHPEVAGSLNNLGELYKEQGKYAAAEPLYRRALAIDEKALGPDHRDVAIDLNNLAVLYDAQGNYAQAEAYFGRGLQNLARQFQNSFTYMSEKDRLQFQDAVRFNLDIYMSFSLTYYREDPALVSKMYDLLLWEKGMVGASIAALRAQVAAGGDAQALMLLDQLAAKKIESARLVSTRPAGWQESRKKVDDEANDLEQQLARRVSSLSAQNNLAHAGWRDVQKKLQPGDAAVEFARFPFYDGKRWTGTSKYVALVITPSRKDTPVLIALGDANDLEGDPLRDYRRRVGLGRVGTGRGVSVEPEEEGPGAAPNTTFYEAFWKPLESALGNARRIYLSPDGALNQVVLGDVPASDGRLLMESYDLRIVTSTKDLLRSSGKPSAHSAVLVGNPTFDLNEAQQRAALRSLRPTEGPQAAFAGEATGPRSRDFRGRTLTPLPGTQAEVQAISSLLEKRYWNVQVFTQRNAQKQFVMQVKGPRVLHLATHGFFESDQQKKEQSLSSDQSSGIENPMLRSGLFFVGANRRLAGESAPADLDDGVLTAYEASTLDLQGTELVVLSACETGLGEVAAGEGVFGLRRALQVAGAESVLMSMWSVPDQETQELMALFYQKWLSGEDKHQALRETQLEMRTRVKARYGKDLPQYWGAFVLVGR